MQTLNPPGEGGLRAFKVSDQHLPTVSDSSALDLCCVVQIKL